jgi:hypothetical protein
MDYFLPSGYTFTAPVMRYPQRNKIFECMMDIIKRFEAFIMFDATGALHIHSLPGGLFSTIVGITRFVFGDFTRNPNNADVSRIILNEKNVTYDFVDTFNKINVLTLDRDTRNAIIYNRSAKFDEDHLVVKKLYMLDQPAYGSLEAAKVHVELLAKRIFWPIRKTSFTTVGVSPLTTPKVLDFIKVDGEEYRLTSVVKKYNVESNDYTVEYNAEWLGGR